MNREAEEQFRKFKKNGKNRITPELFEVLDDAQVYCMERLPGGTIVLQRNRQEIAIGYDLAKKIEINTI